MKCPECGEEIPAGIRICPNCDYELTDAEFAAAGGAPAPAKPDKPAVSAPERPGVAATTKPGKPVAPDVAMPESIMAHGDVSVSTDHSVHNTQNNTQNTTNNTQNNVANTTTNNTTNNTQQTIIINVGAGGQLPGGIVDDATTAAVNDAAAQQQKQQRQQRPQQNAPQVEAEDGQKGVGSITGEGTIYIKTGRRVPTWLIATIIGVVLGIGIAVYLRMSSQPAAEDAKTETVATPKQDAAPAGGQAAAKSGSTAKPAAAKPKPADPYADGMKAYNNGDYDAAVKNLTKASNLSDKQKAGEAAFKLGLMYETGDGVAADKQKAIEWYEKAAKLGNKGAKRKLM